MSSSYRIALDNWLKGLDVKAERLLDLGGAQLPLRGRTKSWDVKEYLVGDLLEPHADSPQPDIVIDLNRYLEPINDPYCDYADYFDLIFCLEVFDYVYDPLTAFKNIEILLKEGGAAWVSFPSTYPLHQPVEDDALRYMRGGIKKLADSAGLKIEEIIYRRPETNLWQQFYTAERMRAAKHEDHTFTGMIVRFSK